jgi:hypothetical protein
MSQQPSDTTDDQVLELNTQNCNKKLKPIEGLDCIVGSVKKSPRRTISHCRRTYWADRFLRPGCIVPLPEDLERRRKRR